jgi:type II secretory pathway pseudopilin PulG
MKPVAAFRSAAAFTLVEIALSLAIIGFAVVAIIGVLPFGLNVQRENREETIIVQEANFLIDAIRSGAQGLDDLTNYVESITNYQARYQVTGAATNLIPGSTATYAYTYAGAWINGNPAPELVITNGVRIIGLLSTPRLIPSYAKDSQGRLLPVLTTFTSNYVVAYVRALNGSAVDKAPQTNAIVRDLAFRYRLIPEIVPFGNWHPEWVDFTVPGLAPEEANARARAWLVAQHKQANLHEVRLLFRWPVTTSGKVGNSRQVFRTMAGGALVPTSHQGMPIWLMQPSIYQAAQ